MLRTAFEQTMKDPDFKAAAAKQKLEVTVSPGKELQDMVNDLYKTPKSLVEKAAKMMPEGAG